MASLWQAMAGVEHEIRYVQAGGIRTRILAAGRGEPLLLLHGTGGHLESFVRNIGPLSRNFKVVAIDLLGHGYTEASTAAPFDWHAVAEHVVDTMDSLSLPSATWVGEALGAQAAQWAAARVPERVKRLVLCCAGILPSDDVMDGSVKKSQAEFQELTRLALAEPSSRSLMHQRMAWLHLDPSSVNDELLEMRCDFWSQPHFIPSQKELLSSLASALRAPRTALTRAEIEQIVAPTLIVWTEQNPLMSMEAGHRLASHIRTSQFEVFRESALWPQFDEADKFNSVLKSWLESTTSLRKA